MDITEIQGYAMFFMTILFVAVLYWYIFYLFYRAEKKGERDFEKYGRIALDDSIGTPPVEEKVASEREYNTKEQN